MTPLRGVRAAEDRARRRDRICPVERRPTAQTTARGKIFAAGEIPVRHPFVGAALFVPRLESPAAVSSLSRENGPLLT